MHIALKKQKLKLQQLISKFKTKIDIMDSPLVQQQIQQPDFGEKFEAVEVMMCIASNLTWPQFEQTKQQMIEAQKKKDLEAGQVLLCVASDLKWPEFDKKYQCEVNNELNSKIEVIKRQEVDELSNSDSIDNTRDHSIRRSLKCKKTSKKRKGPIHQKVNRMRNSRHHRSLSPSQILQNKAKLKIDSFLATSTPVKWVKVNGVSYPVVEPVNVPVQYDEATTQYITSEFSTKYQTSILKMLSHVDPKLSVKIGDKMAKSAKRKRSDESAEDPQQKNSRSGRVINIPKRFRSPTIESAINSNDSELPAAKKVKAGPSQKEESNKGRNTAEDRAKQSVLRNKHILAKAKLLHKMKSLAVDANLDVIIPGTSSASRASNPKLEYIDIFCKNFNKAFGKIKDRHSRLFEASKNQFSLGNINPTDGEGRALEILMDVEIILENARDENCLFVDETKTNKVNQLLEKFNRINNKMAGLSKRFETKFAATKCDDKHYIGTEEERKKRIEDQKSMREEKIAKISVLLEKFEELPNDSKFCGKIANSFIVDGNNKLKLNKFPIQRIDKMREVRISLIMQMLNLLPNRPEVRSAFIAKYIKKRANIKKNKPNGAKKSNTNTKNKKTTVAAKKNAKASEQKKKNTPTKKTAKTSAKKVAAKKTNGKK